ncbi:MAG: S8/S53 family peptidase [Bacteroidota bacterium]
MKPNILSKEFLLITVIMFSFTIKMLYAQSNPSKEILVYFTSGVERAPAGQPATVRSSAIQRILMRFNIDQSRLVSAFPDFNEADTLKTTLEGRTVKLPNMAKIFKIHVPPGTARESVIDSLKKIPNVLFVEPNGTSVPLGDSNDQYYGYQWGLKNVQNGVRQQADIKAPEAWNVYTGSPSSIIGIIDYGVDGTHPDLSGKVSGDAQSTMYHGTHVAGIATAKTNNTTGVAGVDWNAQLLSKNIETSDDAGIYQRIIDAVNYSLSVNVLNNSWALVQSQYDLSPRYSTTVRFAFAYLYKMNRVATCANGNYQLQYPNQTYYPAGFGQGIIAVGATDASDQIANFSQVNNAIDVSAPGVSILSTFRNGVTFSDPNYEYLSGTSMATPFVTGIASLIKGYNPNLYNDDIENIIQISADKVAGMNGQNWTDHYGYGRVNAYKALQFLQAPYQLSQLSAYGGSDLGGSDYYLLIIYGASGLADGRYAVKRHEVRKTVYFTPQYDHYVWGRGVGTNGWSMEAPNYAMGSCEVVPGTVTASSAELRTYVYEVWTVLGQWIGWYPTTASNVSLNYTVLGKQLIAPVISSFTQTPNPIGPGQTGTVVPVLSQGNGNITYTWSYTNKPSWVTVWFSGNTAYVRNDLILAKSSGNNSIQAPAFELTCIASNAAGSSSWSYSPVLSSTLNKDNQNGSNDAIITETKLESNYPNPFNPSTVIKYQIKEKSLVSIKVFDVMGREVTTLVNKYQNAGAFEVIFDASNLPSGVYFYNLVAGSNSITKKMLLIK